MRKTVRILFKLGVCLSALGGVVLSLFQANIDGYSHWSKRLLYYTVFSNVFLGFVYLVLLFYCIFQKPIPRFLFLCKYVSTVCITLTLLVFCFLLAPFAPPFYHLDRFSSMLTHFFSPSLATIDFFLDRAPYALEKSQAFLCTIPPFFYTSFALALSVLSVDFGRGDSYAYVFLNPFSSAKFFGFSREIPFTGTFYWVVFLTVFVWGVGVFFAFLHNKNAKKKQSQ